MRIGTSESDRCANSLTISRRIQTLALAASGVTMLAVSVPAHAATYTGATNGAWLTPGNWSTNLVPGSADEALFATGNTATAVGIDMAGATNNGTNNQIVGRITLTGGQSRGIGNSSTASDGTLTIAGVGGVLIQNTTASNNLTLQNATGSGNKLMNVAFSNAGDIDLTGAGNVTISSKITGSNGFTKTGTGAGLLTLSGANDFAGGVNLNAGSIAVNHATALGTGTFTINGGILRANSGHSIANTTVWNGDFAFGSNTTSNFTFNAATLSLGSAAGPSRTVDVITGGGMYVTGVVSNGTHATNAATRLIKNGGGTIRLNNTANTFSNLTVNAGTILHVSTVAGSNTLAAPASIGTPFGTGEITLGGGTLTWTGPAGGGTSVYRGLANDLNVSTASVLQPFGSQRVNTVLSGLISGAGRLTLAYNPDATNSPATSSVFLTNTNTNTGGISFSAIGTSSQRMSVFVAGATNALGGGASGVGGVTQFVNSANLSGPNPMTLLLKANQTVAGLASVNNTNPVGRHSITGFSETTAAVLTIDNTLSQTGDGSVFTGAIGGNPINIDNNTVNTSGITFTLAASENVRVVKKGTGSQRLSAISSYSGGTVVDGGTLIIDAERADAYTRSGTMTGNSTVITNINTSGLKVGQRMTSAPHSSYQNQYITAIDPNGPNTLGVSAGATAGATGNFVFAAGSSTGTGSVTVNSTGKIMGAGAVYGALTVNTGGTVAPGNSIGTMSTGGLNLAGGTYDVEINTSTVASDLLAVTGNVTLASAVLSLTDLGSNAPLAQDAELVLITYTGTLGGTFASRADDSTFTFGANTFRIDYNDTAGALNAVTLTVVPEPATLGLLGLAGLALRRRRA